MWRWLVAPLLLLLTGLTVFNAPPTGPTPPCDAIITCAEAYNVDQRAISTYSGPLFQLVLVANPTGPTLNVGQTALGTADMTTWSAFCSGVQTNCMYSTIYAQINTSVNDVSYAISCGTFCGCKFQINATTGLPEVPMVAPCMYSIGGNADNPATGIPGGANDISVIATGRNIQTAAQCCGFFGMYHKYNAPDTPGTDFALQVQYSNTGSFANCVSATKACLCSDLEINTICGPDFPASPIDLLGVMTWAHVANTTTAEWNGHSAWNQTPPVSLAPGNHIHFGAGGDLTQPAPFIFRGGYIVNGVLSGGQEAALLANVQAFYPGLTFP